MRIPKSFLPQVLAAAALIPSGCEKVEEPVRPHQPYVVPNIPISAEDLHRFQGTIPLAPNNKSQTDTN